MAPIFSVITAKLFLLSITYGFLFGPDSSDFQNYAAIFIVKTRDAEAVLLFVREKVSIKGVKQQHESELFSDVAKIQH
ncbi:MAG TPA: hypothetical protein VIS57_10870 [Xanthomonadales bacterium]